MTFSTASLGTKAHAEQTENNKRPTLQELSPEIDWEAVRNQIAARPLAKDGASPRLRLVNPALAVKAAAEEISRPQLPILVVNQPEALKNLKLYGQENAYFSATELEDGIIARVSGTKKQLRLERPPERLARLNIVRGRRPPLPKLGAPYVITRSHSSTDLSFSLFKAGYVLSVICDDPQTDERCNEDQYIKNLAAALGLINRPPSPRSFLKK